MCRVKIDNKNLYDNKKVKNVSSNKFYFSSHSYEYKLQLFVPLLLLYEAKLPFLRDLKWVPWIWLNLSVSVKFC